MLFRYRLAHTIQVHAVARPPMTPWPSSAHQSHRAPVFSNLSLLALRHNVRCTVNASVPCTHGLNAVKLSSPAAHRPCNPAPSASDTRVTRPPIHACIGNHAQTCPIVTSRRPRGPERRPPWPPWPAPHPAAPPHHTRRPLLHHDKFPDTSSMAALLGHRRTA